MEILSIITARGGSKTVPRKNVRLLNGKPLIAWNIEAALKSEKVTRVIVSTDDNEIAHVSAESGAEIPFMRPPKLGTDETTTIDVLLHAIKTLKTTEGYNPDIIVHMQPTSPFTTPNDIDTAITQCEPNTVDAVVSVCEVDHSPYWLHHIEPDGRMTNFLDQVYVTRRQDHRAVYQRNGALYLAKTPVLLRDGSFYKSRLHAYIMPTERSLDIDNERDFMIAEFFMSHENAS